MTHYTSIEDVRAYVDSVQKNSYLNNRDISLMRYSTVRDNHIPTRNYGVGYVVKYTNDRVEQGYVLFHDEQFGKNRKLAFLIDDGETVRPYYMASYNESGGFFILHPLPTGLTIGPRTFYHVTVKEFDPGPAFPPDYKGEFAGEGDIGEFAFGTHVQEGLPTTHIKHLNDFPYEVHEQNDTNSGSTKSYRDWISE